MRTKISVKVSQIAVRSWAVMEGESRAHAHRVVGFARTQRGRGDGRVRDGRAASPRALEREAPTQPLTTAEL